MILMTSTTWFLKSMSSDIYYMILETDVIWHMTDVISHLLHDRCHMTSTTDVIWHMTDVIWHLLHDSWNRCHMTYDRCHMTSTTWFLSYDICYRCHMTHNRCHMTSTTWFLKSYDSLESYESYPPKNGLIALLLTTNGLMCSKTVSQKRNEAIDNSQSYKMWLNFILWIAMTLY